MAQVDIGKIKIVWKAAWDSSTAYTVDDAVSHSGSSYICIQAGSNQNPSSATAYWQVMASAGTNGTDGTDVGATLANKEIAFKTNAGAVDGIPIGNAGEFLKVNSGATGYEYGAVSSDFVKISTIDVSSAVGELAFNTQFSSTYKMYKLIFKKLKASANNNELFLRYRVGTSNQTNADAYYATYMTSYYNGNSGSTNNSNTKQNYMRILNWSMPYTSDATYGWNGEFNFYDPQANMPTMGGLIHGYERNFDNLLNATFAHSYNVSISNIDGFTLYLSAGANFTDGTATLYGIKE